MVVAVVVVDDVVLAVVVVAGGGGVWCYPCSVFSRFRSGRESSNRWCFRVFLQLAEQKTS